jgi:transposase
VVLRGTAGSRYKQRLAILEYTRSHSLLAASRRFAMNRKTIREWRTRYRAQGARGLIPGLTASGTLRWHISRPRGK